MRIGIFTDTYVPSINGVTTSVILLKKELEKRGHIVYIVTSNDEKCKLSIENKVIKIPGFKTGIYDYKLTEIYSIKAACAIKKWKLDVIHSQTEFGIGTFARIISKKYKIPLVHTYHTMYEDCLEYVTKGYFNKTSKKILKYLTLFYCDKTVDELIVPTLKTYKLFKGKYKVKRDIHIIETGIDCNNFYTEKRKINGDLERKKLNIESDDFVILFVGRLGKEKNIDFLVTSMNNIVKKNRKIKLLIVGTGPLEESLKQYTDKFNLNNNIIFTGGVKWEEIYKYYALSDLFVTASCSETQGITVLESLASCTPVVCINDDSYKNIVVNNINGMIFNNKNEFINIILDLCSNQKVLNKLVNNAIITRECFSSSNFCDKIIDVYDKAISDKKRKEYNE